MRGLRRPGGYVGGVVLALYQSYLCYYTHLLPYRGCFHTGYYFNATLTLSHSLPLSSYLFFRPSSSKINIRLPPPSILLCLDSGWVAMHGLHPITCPGLNLPVLLARYRLIWARGCLSAGL